jgi:hypothetical protein
MKRWSAMAKAFTELEKILYLRRVQIQTNPREPTNPAKGDDANVNHVLPEMRNLTVLQF